MVAKAFFFIMFCAVLINPDPLRSQVGIGTNIPDSSAALEIKSTDRGFLPPRLTTSQIFYINGPEPGLMVYNTDSLDIWCFNGIRWKGLFDQNDTLNPGYWFCGLDLLYAGEYYSTREIGDQCWMTKNLNVGTMINSSQNPIDDGQIEKYCNNNLLESCAVYGGLYAWNEMMNYVTDTAAQGICPDGWHIPDDEEWKVLEGTVDSYYGIGDPEWDDVEWRGTDAGGNLKEEGTIHWVYPNLGGTNSSMFTALPGGCRFTDGSFISPGTDGLFWSSTQQDVTFAYGRLLQWSSNLIARYPDYTKAYGLSVRCLKD